jgi:hypothetical protein
MANTTDNGTVSGELMKDAIAELQGMVGDLDGRIERQHKRIARAQVNAGTSKAHTPERQAIEEMKALLGTMVENRDVVQARLTAIETN